jgi:hypothetical protein
MAFWFVFGILTLISTAIAAGILAIGLWILSDGRSSPFQEHGVAGT